MAGNKDGAQKANATKDKKYGVEWRTTLASMGGKVSTPGGFGTLKVGADGLTGVERARLAREKQLRNKETENATRHRNSQSAEHSNEVDGEPSS